MEKELNPEYADAYYFRGIAKRNKGDYGGAITDFTKAIEMNPKFADAYSNRGYARYEKGDHIGKMADFNRAEEIEKEGKN